MFSAKLGVICYGSPRQLTQELKKEELTIKKEGFKVECSTSLPLLVLYLLHKKPVASRIMALKNNHHGHPPLLKNPLYSIGQSPNP